MTSARAIFDEIISESKGSVRVTYDNLFYVIDFVTAVTGKKHL
jgi:hypothetical protein